MPSPQLQYEHRHSHFDLRKILIGFFILQKQLASQDVFLMRFEISITVYFFLALIGSTALQSRSFLKNIKIFCASRNLWIIVVFLQCTLKRKITFCSHKHSFTPCPSLSPYWQTDRMTDRGTNTLATHGLEEPFFQLCCCVSFLFWWEKGFGFTYYLCT